MEIKNLFKGIGDRAILNAGFLQKFCKTASNLYRLGWDERNGGNMSMMLDAEEVGKYLDVEKCERELDMSFAAPELAGKIFLVTGTGKYFKNIEDDPSVNLGIFRISDDGKRACVLWGYEDGGRFTSELPAHLMSHIERLKRDPEQRVVIHTHPTNIVAMTFVHELNDRAFTHTLWQMCTECLVVFPDGVGVLPWMLCGNNEIGRATAEKMKDYRLVVWANHGIYGAGRDLDETFGLIETAEKAAQIYMLIGERKIKNTITDDNLRELAAGFGIKFREDFLGK